MIRLWRGDIPFSDFISSSLALISGRPTGWTPFVRGQVRGLRGSGRRRKLPIVYKRLISGTRAFGSRSKAELAMLMTAIETPVDLRALHGINIKSHSKCAVHESYLA